MVIPDDENDVRQFAVPVRSLRLVLAASLVVLFGLASLAAGFFWKENQQRKAAQLESDLMLLTAELDEIRARFGDLRNTLEELSSRDDLHRMLAGLNPMDDDVRLAGIGGPGMPRLETNRLWLQNSELGERAFATAYDLNALQRRAKLLETSWAEARTTAITVADSLASLPSIWPTVGYISSGFSFRRWHPLMSAYLPHPGIDISAPTGTPIVASARGRVTFVGRQGDYGNTVEIDHGNGYQTLYAHAHRTHVSVGQLVERGQKIAEVGNTGRSTGPHLHYEVSANGRPVNPRNFMIDWNPLRD